MAIYVEISMLSDAARPTDDQLFAEKTILKGLQAVFVLIDFITYRALYPYFIRSANKVVLALPKHALVRYKIHVSSDAMTEAKQSNTRHI